MGLGKAKVSCGAGGVTLYSVSGLFKEFKIGGRPIFAETTGPSQRPMLPPTPSGLWLLIS